MIEETPKQDSKLPSPNKPLWVPNQDTIAGTLCCQFIQAISRKYGLNFSGFYDFYAWSVREPEKFWLEFWSSSGIVHSGKLQAVLSAAEKLPGAIWFEGIKLNFAENLLAHRGDSPAIIFWGEEKLRRELTFDQLRSEVACVARHFRELGVAPGDRVAGIVPNMPEAIIGMLATASLGAIWTSCSPDFGASGIVDRFGQTTPKILITCDSYYFKGSVIDCLQKARQVAQEIPSIEKVFVIPYGSAAAQVTLPSGWSEFPSSDKSAPQEKLQYEHFPFNHPLYIMYSSGTTGKPKCIVHGAGGTLLEHLKEHRLHTDLRTGERLFYQTTCGWMMWNWLVSGLASGATLILYDGSPLERGGKILFDLAEKENVNVFGTNAKFLALIEKMKLKPARSHRLSALRAILSTGSPLAPESFDYVYRDIKQDLCLSSISGGTDIIGCFALGSAMLPVFRSELQTRSLALKVEVFNQAGQSVREQKGELVCTAPFPSMPLYFWNDPQGEKYRAAYFLKYPGVWHHGDYVELTANNGMIFYGRSDTVLNPGGVRIGTSEIYTQVEALPDILESIAVGQEWQGDERVVLFVKLKDGAELNDALRDRIRAQIRKGASVFHVPKKIIAVSDIPRTRSGKIVELAVREVIHGRPVQNIEALANPEALRLFENIAALASD